MWTVAWVSSTTANGRPYGGFPKSGWRFVLPAFIEASHALLLGFTGRDEMSVIQMLSAGNTVQLASAGSKGVRRWIAVVPAWSRGMTTISSMFTCDGRVTA